MRGTESDDVERRPVPLNGQQLESVEMSGTNHGEVPAIERMGARHAMRSTTATTKASTNPTLASAYRA